MSLARLIGTDSLPSYARERLAAVRELRRDSLLQCRFPLPLLDLDCWFSEPRMLALCEQRFALRSGDEAVEGLMDVFVVDPTYAGWEPPATWDVARGFASQEFATTLERAGLRGFYHHEAPSWQFYDPMHSTGLHTLPRPMAIPPWESGSPLRLFLHWAYAQRGVRLTHAATLGVEGSGALLAGASGSGKSGTALAGLLHGLESAGDDYVVVEQGDEITAHAIFSIFKQDPDGLRRAGLDPIGVGSNATNWHGKHEFNVARLMPSHFVKRMEIKSILVPKVARLRRTQIEPISAAQAALALAPSAVLQLQSDSVEGFRFFAALSRRLPAFKVHLSEDPREIASVIGDHLLRRTRRAN